MIKSHGKATYCNGNKLFDFCGNPACISIRALISIRLDYCNSILYNLPKNSILMLQIIQNQAARILTKTLRRDHITEVLIDLHWLRIEERIGV